MRPMLQPEYSQTFKNLIDGIARSGNDAKVRQGNISLMKNYLEQNPDLLIAYDAEGHSLMKEAIVQNNMSVVQMMVEAGVDFSAQDMSKLNLKDHNEANVKVLKSLVEAKPHAVQKGIQAQIEGWFAKNPEATKESFLDEFKLLEKMMFSKFEESGARKQYSQLVDKLFYARELEGVKTKIDSLKDSSGFSKVVNKFVASVIKLFTKREAKHKGAGEVFDKIVEHGVPAVRTQGTVLSEYVIHTKGSRKIDNNNPILPTASPSNLSKPSQPSNRGRE